MPEEFVEFGRSWLHFHPGWEMIHWNEENMPELINQKEFDQSKALSGKANVLRYEILRKFGGVYVDTDFECFGSLEQHLRGVRFFVGDMGFGLINNAIIGCEAEHPAVALLIRELPETFRARANGKSLYQSGPYFLTRILRTADLSEWDAVIFPREAFYGYSWAHRYVFNQPFKRDDYPDALAIHHWAASWRT